MGAVRAVVPAAGLSRRFGGPNKLLQPFEDTTVVGAVVRTLLACGLHTVVVTGRDADEVARAVAPARAVFNPDYESGLGASIAAGVRAVPEGSAVLVALGDMPGLRADVVRAVLGAQGPDAIVVPTYSDAPHAPGHPVLFAPGFRGALLALSGDEGARSVIASNVERVVRLAVPGALHDLDAPH